MGPGYDAPGRNASLGGVDEFRAGDAARTACFELFDVLADPGWVRHKGSYFNRSFGDPMVHAARLAASLEDTSVGVFRARTEIYRSRDPEKVSCARCLTPNSPKDRQWRDAIAMMRASVLEPSTGQNVDGLLDKRVWLIAALNVFFLLDSRFWGVDRLGIL